MSEEEKYWGCTPVVTAHMEARMKASREYAKMVSNDDETPAQRADRARDFESGAIWEEGYSKQFGWHPASEPPIPDAPYISVVFCKWRNGWIPFTGYGCDISPKKTVEFINRINDAADVLNRKGGEE